LGVQQPTSKLQAPFPQELRENIQHPTLNVEGSEVEYWQLDSPGKRKRTPTGVRSE
jgi:hypothetical protein